MAIPSFVDRVSLTVAGGNGGNGCASVHREKFKPLGGPNGGNGGDGGSVIIRVDPQLTTLIDYHRAQLRRATNGEPGKGDHNNGAKGEDIVLPVPDGTVISDFDTGEVLADLTGTGAEIVIARGGKGGLGNAALANAARKAPGFALLGEEGEARKIWMELKVVADVGLVGFPSAGKSSLVAAISAARPKIADYPFTTLVPNLGVVLAGEMIFTVADVPGLIEGAAEGKGLGHDFLRHIERCQVLVHVVDLATFETNRDPVGDLEKMEAELAAYGGLEDRPRIVALNKVDIPDGRDLAEIVAEDVAKFGWPVHVISTVTGEGVKALTYEMGTMVQTRRAAMPAPKPARIVLRPKPSGSQADFSVEKTKDSTGALLFRVRGKKPHRWVRQTDFNNDEAVGYLADRLAKLGVEEALSEAGAKRGDPVAIGPDDDAVVFDFEPQIQTGAEILSRRGEDNRLISARPAVARRKQIDAEYHTARGDLNRFEFGDLRRRQALSENKNNLNEEAVPPALPYGFDFSDLEEFDEME